MGELALPLVGPSPCGVGAGELTLYLNSCHRWGSWSCPCWPSPAGELAPYHVDLQNQDLLSCPSLKGKESWWRPTAENSATTQAQHQGFELVHLTTYPIDKLLEWVKGSIL